MTAATPGQARWILPWPLRVPGIASGLSASLNSAMVRAIGDPRQLPGSRLS
jgi:hypothetical protein